VPQLPCTAQPSDYELVLDQPPAILVFNADGLSGAPVDVRQRIPIGPGYRLGACVEWVGGGHVIARVCDCVRSLTVEARLPDMTVWRTYDDNRVEDVRARYMVHPGVIRRQIATDPEVLLVAPFKLAFYCPQSEPLDSSAQEARRRR
jgi:hypothetical protein